MGRNEGRSERARNATARGPAEARLRGDPGHPAFRIADSPFYRLVRTVGRYELDMHRALRSIEMDVPSWRALMLVHETNPSSVSEIADRAVMQLSTMTRIVQRLEKRGLVRLAARASDARVTDVHITPPGERALAHVRAIASRIYNIAFHDFTADEIAVLNALLGRVYSNLAMEPEEAAPVRRQATVAARRRR